MIPSLRTGIEAPAFLGLAATVVAVLAAALLPVTSVTDVAVPPFFWVVVALAFASAVLAFQRLNRRAREMAGELEAMTRAADEIARGDLRRSVDIDALPAIELRDLAQAINAMATRARGDIDEMKRLERVRSEFIGNVSHELRTPIFSVQGYLETLLDGAVDDITVRDDFLRKAHHNVLRLHTLLADLIEISKIESGEMRMSRRYFDAVGYLRAIVEEARPTAEMADVTLVFNVIADSESEVQVLGDRDRLKQVMVNLIENAVKYNRPGGTVTVEIEAVREGAVIRVRDTGIGIPAGDINRIFERFYRVNRDRSRAVGGSGLGLAIVKHILEKHESTVQVTSAVGEGSEFSFILKR